MGKVGISSPWVSYYHELKAFFAEDPDIKIGFDNDAPEVKIFVENDDKAEALAEALPSSKNFGNVNLKISIIPANEKKSKRNENESLLKRVFKNNEAVEDIKEIVYPGGCYAITYVIFKNCVVQYWNDNLADAHGLVSTLYEDLARYLFEQRLGNVMFCTAPGKDSVASPLGEWP